MTFILTVTCAYLCACVRAYGKSLEYTSSICMSISTCVCLYIYRYIYIYIYITYVYTHTHTHTHIYIYIDTHTCIYTDGMGPFSEKLPAREMQRIPGRRNT
jgi:hypothetical protein